MNGAMVGGMMGGKGENPAGMRLEVLFPSLLPTDHRSPSCSLFRCLLLSPPLLLLPPPLRLLLRGVAFAWSYAVVLRVLELSDRWWKLGEG